MDFIAEYKYRNEKGDLQYSIRRTKDKQFIPLTPDGKNHLDGITRVLYNLPEVIEASNNHGIVFVVESEKSADLMTSLGLVATCSSGGANWEWPRSYGNYFAGCERVYVLPDNDDPGRAAAEQRARIIAGVCNDVRIVELSNLQHKEDVWDYLQVFDVDKLYKECEYATTIDIFKKKIQIEVEDCIVAYLMRESTGAQDVFRSVYERDFTQPFWAAAFHAIQSMYSVGLKPDVRSVALRMVRNKYPLPQEEIESKLWMLYETTYDFKAINTWIYDFTDAAARRSVEQAVKQVANQIQDGLPGSMLVTSWEAATATLRRSVGTVEEAPNVQDIVEARQNYDWLLPNFLERTNRMILVASEGAGKATFLRQMAVKAAAGIDMWDDSIRRDPVKVLVVDRENSIGQISRDIKFPYDAANHIAGIGWKNNLRYEAKESALNILSKTDRDYFESLIITNRPDIVFCLPVYKLFEEDSNQSSEKNAQQFIKIIDGFRERYGCAFVFEAHAPLGDFGKNRIMRPNGSSVWLRWPELGWGFRPEDRPGYFKVTPFRGSRNDQIKVPDMVWWNPRKTGWRWCYSFDTP